MKIDGRKRGLVGLTGVDPLMQSCSAEPQYLHEVLSRTAEVDWDMAGSTSFLSSSICFSFSSLSVTVTPSSPDATFSTSEAPPSESDGSSSTPPTWPLEREKRENRIPPIPFPILAAPAGQWEGRSAFPWKPRISVKWFSDLTQGSRVLVKSRRRREISAAYPADDSNATFPALLG